MDGLYWNIPMNMDDLGGTSIILNSTPKIIIGHHQAS